MTHRTWLKSDIETLSEWFKNETTARRLGGMLPLDKFYDYASAQENKRNLMFFDDEKAVGHSDAEVDGDTVSVSVLVNPKCRGQGYGRQILQQVIRLYAGKRLYAGIEEDNIESITLFSSCGFALTGKDKDGFLEYILETL